MRSAKHAVLVILLVLCAGAFAAPARADVSFSFFYSNLSPHGSWHVSGLYGRVWQPHVYASGWNPYYDGRWAYTDVGWSWVSDYPWGALPYHYGTWVADPVYGWVWVPGYVWAPAWVVFRTGPGYIGWAPVPPGYSVGVSIALAAPRADRFVFVSTRDFLAPRIRACALPRSRARVIVDRTVIVNRISVENNVVVNRGPDLSIVERASGRRVRPVPIERVPRVSSSPRAGRDQFRVDPGRVGRALPATEPVSARRGYGSDSIGERTHRGGRSLDRSSVAEPRAASQARNGSRFSTAPKRSTPSTVTPRQKHQHISSTDSRTGRPASPKMSSRAQRPKTQGIESRLQGPSRESGTAPRSKADVVRKRNPSGRSDRQPPAKGESRRDRREPGR